MGFCAKDGGFLGKSLRYCTELCGVVEKEVFLTKDRHGYHWEGAAVSLGDMEEIFGVQWRKMGFVYLIRSEWGFKIGKSKNIHDRLKLFNVKLPFKWELLSYILCEDYGGLEREFHRNWADRNLDGEWFDLSEDDIRYFLALSHRSVSKLRSHVVI